MIKIFIEIKGVCIVMQVNYAFLHIYFLPYIVKHNGQVETCSKILGAYHAK